MKRHERISKQARQHAGWSLILLTAMLAAAGWTVRVWQSSASGGVLMLAVTLAVFVLAFAMAAESFRLFQRASEEIHWDEIRSKRPRL